MQMLEVCIPEETYEKLQELANLGTRTSDLLLHTHGSTPCTPDVKASIIIDSYIDDEIRRAKDSITLLEKRAEMKRGRENDRL